MSSITCHVPAYDDPDRAQYHDVPDVAYDPPRPPGAFVVSGPMNGRPKGRRLRSLTDHTGPWSPRWPGRGAGTPGSWPT